MEQDQQGIAHGDHVAVLLPNSLAYVVLIHALARVGAVLVPLNIRLGASEIDWQKTRDISAIGISAGASAPEIVVQEIIDACGERFDVTVDIALTVEETENFPVMRDLRDTELVPADMAFLTGAGR